MLQPHSEHSDLHSAPGTRQFIVRIRSFQEHKGPHHFLIINIFSFVSVIDDDDPDDVESFKNFVKQHVKLAGDKQTQASDQPSSSTS